MSAPAWSSVFWAESSTASIADVCVWRLTRKAYQKLDGSGARLYGGRWSSEGRPVVYSSSTLALAALEYLVHVDIEDVPDDLVALAIRVPEDAPAEFVKLDELPGDWARLPGHPECVRFGDRWLANATALLLHVPSAVVPEETNVLINPAHPDARRVRIESWRRFVFDPRLI